MKILCIGDVVGNIGCTTIRNKLPGIKKQYSIDLVIANGENSAEGNGIVPASAEDLFCAGVNVITGGNHTLRRIAFHHYLDENPFVLRPENCLQDGFGTGLCIVDMGYTLVAVINLLGVAYMQSADCPFKTADRLIEKARTAGANIIIVDFHAEATSEKRALGYYLDGRVTAVVGTHTHVQTADEQILPGGTAYITDLGMTGPDDSVLGVKKEIIISRMKDNLPLSFETADGKCTINGCIIEVDRTGKNVIGIKRISI